MLTRPNIITGLLVTSALLLAAAHFRPQTVVAREAVAGRDYQLVTAPVIKGGDGLYVMDNRTGLVAFFVPEVGGGGIRVTVKDVRPMSELMGEVLAPAPRER